MSTVTNYIEEVVNDAYQHTDTLIVNVQKSLLPAKIDLEYNFIRNGRYRYDNETVKDEDHLILKVEGIRDKSYFINHKADAIYRLRVDQAIAENKIYPFILFVNGIHMKWTDIIIVNDVRYTYLLLPSNPFKNRFQQIQQIKSVECIHIPFNVFYTEDRVPAPDSSYIEAFRFSSDGLLMESGKVIYYISHPALVMRDYSFADGEIKAYDLEIDHNIKLSEDNFFVFKEREYTTEDELVINRLNLLYLNGDKAKYKIKVFYRTDINSPYNIVNKFPNVQLAKDLTQGKIVNPRIDTKILNTTFNFTHDPRKSEMGNMRTNFRYMTAYDSEFLTKVYEKINVVETKAYTGAEIREKVNFFGILSMLLLKYKQKQTFVMVFCNGYLYQHNSDITYGVNTFDMPIDMRILNDNDRFEFVFFKNINNYSEIIRYTEENRFKEDEAFADDELVLYSRDPGDHGYLGKIKFNDRTWFKVDHTLDENKNVIVDDYYNGKEILYTTKNQFKYCFRKIQKDGMKIRLTPDFMASLNPKQYMVFVNGKILNRGFYRIITPARDNTFTDPYLYSRVKFNRGDKVEVYYGPIEFDDIDYSGNMKTEIVSITASKNGQLSFIIPYPFKLYSYRDDFVVFMDSVYVDPDRYTLKRGLLTFTDGTYIEKGTKLSFVFVFDECEEQESAIYINNDNGIYMETIYLPIVIDGQTKFDLGNDKYIEWLMAGNSVMVLYHGLYVPSEFWVLNKYTGVFTFAPNTFKRDDYITVVLFHVPGEIIKNTNDIIIKDDWTTTITASDLTGFPYIYYLQMPFSRLEKEGVTNILAKVTKTGENLAQARMDNYNVMISAAENRKFTGFPYTYTQQISFHSLLTNDWFTIKLKIIDNAEVLIDARLDKYKVLEDYEAGTISISTNIDNQLATKGGIQKSETVVQAKEDEQTEFDSTSITGFPINYIQKSSMKVLETYGKQQYIDKAVSYAYTLIETEMNRMDTSDFDVGEYIREGRPIFIMKNGVLLTEDVHYSLLRESNKIKFVDPLMKGDKIYIVSYSSYGKSIKSYEHNILITDKDQLVYDLYDVFGTLDDAKKRFMVYIGSIVYDPRRYTITKDCKLIFADNKGLEVGRHIRIVALYIDEERDSIYTYNYLGSSRYHNIDQVKVPFEPDTYTYDIPYPAKSDKESGFVIMVAGEILDPQRYTIDYLRQTITFVHQDDPIFTNYTEFTFVFLYDEMKTLTVTTALGDKVEDKRMTYNVPVPFPNYFQVGNNVLVFDGSILMDPERYTIDKENLLITFAEGERITGTQLRFVYVYNSNSKNIAYMDEDVTISTIRKNGYVNVNKGLLKHPLSKSLFWLFLNGKKVNLDDITNISSNMVKINKDQQSRYNLMLLSHTPEEEELKQYFKAYSNYDTLINNLNVQDLNSLFNSHILLSDTDPKFGMDYSREALVLEIVRDWYGRNNLYKGDLFANTFENNQTTDVLLGEGDDEPHSMVLDASQFFSAPLDRSNTNPDTVQR